MNTSDPTSDLGVLFLGKNITYLTDLNALLFRLTGGDRKQCEL